MNKTMIAVIVLALAGCATTSTDQQQQQPDALAVIKEHCGVPKSPEDPVFGECYAQLVAEARTQVQCREYLESLTPALLEAAAEYQMLYGRRPPGVEAVCGESARAAHLEQLREEVRQTLRAPATTAAGEP
jgi:hypothetical protein